jgi:hypothetical protein
VAPASAPGTRLRARGELPVTASGCAPPAPRRWKRRVPSSPAENDHPEFRRRQQVTKETKVLPTAGQYYRHACERRAHLRGEDRGCGFRGPPCSFFVLFVALCRCRRRLRGSCQLLVDVVCGPSPGPPAAFLSAVQPPVATTLVPFQRPGSAACDRRTSCTSATIGPEKTACSAAARSG